MNKTWTTEAIQFIIDNCDIYNDSKMAQELTNRFGRIFTTSATRKKRQRLKITKEAHRGYFKIKSKG